MSVSGDTVQPSDKALGAVRVAGADARAFLQGQLSNDLRSLGGGNSMLAALNTPQGRVVAVLRLMERPEGIYALLPATLAAPVIERLRKYVLRSKVTLAPAEEFAVVPLDGDPLSPASGKPPLAGAVDAEPVAAAALMPADVHRMIGDVSLVRLAGAPARTLAIGPAAELERAMNANGWKASTWNQWRAAQIAAGEPQIYPATSEQYVAQMLNLDLIGALSFNKGCYTGQEIIVRTQHLGRIKRRMIRAQAAGARIPIGAEILAASGRVGEVLESVDGEVLAVIQVSALDEALLAEGSIALQRLPLRYDLPG